MPFTIKDAVFWAASYLKEKGIDSYKLDSELILAHVLKKNRVYLYAHPEMLLNPAILNTYKKIVIKRGKRFPLAYLIGEKEFFGRSFFVERGVFCPRPETEILIEEAINTLSKLDNPSIFEIGLGTGIISITLTLELNLTKVYGCDISKKAISVTKKNINAYQLNDRIKIFQGKLFDAVKDFHFDCIVSNPPYLSKSDYLEAEPDVRKEPKRALMAKDKGLAIIKKLIRSAEKRLNRGGYLFIEIGDGQGEKVLKYAEKYYLKASIIKDLAGKERVLKAIKISN